jgi:hypothetical protein
MGDFSLLPSVVVFGVVVAVVVLAVRLLRARSRRRPAPAIGGAPVRESVDELVRRASIQLVQMDDGIRSADEELEFARAEFGDAAADEFAEALATAKHRASEAFAIKQRLDDSVPDTEQERRDWARRILSLSDSALALAAGQARAFAERRRTESTAAESLRRLGDLAAAARARVPDARLTLAAIAGSYDPAAVADDLDAPDRATAALDAADGELEAARAELARDPLAAVARRTRAAEAELTRATAALDAAERLPAALDAARSSLSAAIDAARAQLAEAERLRDTVDDHDDTVRMTAAAERMRTALSTATTRRPAHPAADLDAIAAAAADLDATVAVARSAQQRIDAARGALAGALRIAESHLQAAEQYIAARRGGVGTDARTRLASAHRELERARLEADPIAALDTARRAATLATDADALARYDTLHA